MKRQFLISTIAAAAFAGAAFAEAPMFDTVDTDGDGLVSLSEAQAVAPDLTEDGFAAFDLNADGGLDNEEFAAWVATLPTEEHAEEH
jgi:Ca2+-binding EF-hand superfamily protein